jgi:hypothetical protein
MSKIREVEGFLWFPLKPLNGERKWLTRARWVEYEEQHPEGGPPIGNMSPGKWHATHWVEDTKQDVYPANSQEDTAVTVDVVKEEEPLPIRKSISDLCQIINEQEVKVDHAYSTYGCSLTYVVQDIDASIIFFKYYGMIIGNPSIKVYCDSSSIADMDLNESELKLINETCENKIQQYSERLRLDKINKIEATIAETLTNIENKKRGNKTVE